MKFLYGAAITAAVVLGSASASFADCNGGRFAGLHVGLTAGVGGFEARQDAVPTVLNPQPETDSARGRSTTFVPGAEIGYDIQCGSIVAGVAVDASYLGVRANSDWPDPVTMQAKIGWFETVRGKLGVTMRDDLLLYGTAGVAFANVSESITFPTLPAFQSDSRDKTGLVYGGGLELARTDRVLLTAEALHVDLGKDSRDYSFDSGCCTGTVDWKNSFWVGRIGVSMKFGEEPKYVPLK